MWEISRLASADPSTVRFRASGRLFATAVVVNVQYPGGGLRYVEVPNPSVTRTRQKYVVPGFVVNGVDVVPVMEPESTRGAVKVELSSTSHSYVKVSVSLSVPPAVQDTFCVVLADTVLSPLAGVVGAVGGGGSMFVRNRSSAGALQS